MDRPILGPKFHHRRFVCRGGSDRHCGDQCFSRTPPSKTGIARFDGGNVRRADERGGAGCGVISTDASPRAFCALCGRVDRGNVSRLQKAQPSHDERNDRENSQRFT